MHRFFCVPLLLLVVSSCAPAAAPLTPSQAEAVKQRLAAGTIRPQCATGCFDAFVASEELAGVRYAKEDWGGLTQTVADAGHENELAYFYLGSAAEGLGYPAAAAAYYRQSATLARDGRGDQRCTITLPCPFPAGARAEERLARLGAPAAAPATSTQLRPAPPQANSRQGVSPDEFRSATFYDATYAERQITLRNGEWRVENTPLGRSDDPTLASLVWKLEKSAIGDLNGDGVADGVFAVRSHVIIASGQELYLIAVSAGPDGRRAQSKPYLLGDNTAELKSIAIKRGVVVVKLHVPQNGQDPWEKPKGRITLNLVLTNGELHPLPAPKHRTGGGRQ